VIIAKLKEARRMPSARSSQLVLHILDRRLGRHSGIHVPGEYGTHQVHCSTQINSLQNHDTVRFCRKEDIQVKDTTVSGHGMGSCRYGKVDGGKSNTAFVDATLLPLLD